MSAYSLRSEPTISSAISDNETNKTTPTLTPSDDCVRGDVTQPLEHSAETSSTNETIPNDPNGRTVNFILNLLKGSDTKPKENANDTESDGPTCRRPAIKREKSHTDSIERKKKKVKFSVHADEIIPTSKCVSLDLETNKTKDLDNSESNFSKKFKKLLNRNRGTKNAAEDNPVEIVPIIKEDNVECSNKSGQPCMDVVNDKVTTECGSSSFKTDDKSDLKSDMFSDLDYIDSSEDLEHFDYENQPIHYSHENEGLDQILKSSPSESENIYQFGAVSLKREGTFTLDDLPPHKVIKQTEESFEDSLENSLDEITVGDLSFNTIYHGEALIIDNIDNIDNIDSIDSIDSIDNKSNIDNDNTHEYGIDILKKSVGFDIDSTNENKCVPSTPTTVEKRGSILKRQRPLSFEESLENPIKDSIKENTPSPQSTTSNNSVTVQSCIPKPSVTSLSSNARKTISNVWRNAVTRQDSTKSKKQMDDMPTKQSNTKIKIETDKTDTKVTLVKPAKNTKKSSVKNETNSKIPTSSRWSWKNETNIKKESQEKKDPQSSKDNENQPIKEKDSIKTDNKIEPKEKKTQRSSIVARASSWSGIGAPRVKRDNTFMKIDAKKYDSEKERLQNEVCKLNVEKDRLQGEVLEIRSRHEQEIASRKAQKRLYEVKLKQQKEEDAKKHELHIGDIKNRLEEDKRESLCQLKDCLTRTYETELLRNNRGKDEETRKLLSEARLTVERLQTSLRREALKEVQPVSCQHHSADRELERLTRELTIYKEQKKKLDESVQRLQSAERLRVAEIRQLHEQHENTLSKLLKGNKQEATRLLEEIKSKDRVISSLEKRINQQDAKIRQQEDKHRDAVKDESGRKLQSGRSSSISQRSKSSTPREDSLSPTLKDGAQDKETGGLPNPAPFNSESEEALKDSSAEKEQDMKMSAADAEVSRLKKMVEEQQQQISSLIQQSVERENPEHLQLQVWPQKRESCIKASELPTVMEQVSDDEASPTHSPTTNRHTITITSSPTESEPLHSYIPYIPQVPEELNWIQNKEEPVQRPHRLQLPHVQPFRRCVSLMSSPSTYKGPTDWAKEQRLKNLESKNASLEAELQEARDHADLLEFRILEVTEGSEKGCEKSINKVDQSTSTSTLEGEPSISPLPPTEDLSLPLSIDSGVDFTTDTKVRITEGKSWLNQLSKLAVESSDKTAAHSLASLLEWLGNSPSLPLSPTQHALPGPMSPTAKALGRMGPEEHGFLSGGDLTLLAARLQESLTDPPVQETALVDTIAKLRMLDSSLSGLQSRVSILTEENKELQEALTALSESHETRTEASGTESEIVHRKTPSIHSDLSDAESDPDTHLHRHTKNIGNAISFQESGIFDSSCDFANASTQTKSLDILTTSTSSITCNDDASSDCSDVDLKTAVARLASIRSVVQDRELRSMRIQDLQESDEYLNTELEGEKVVISKLEYDSIVAAERQLQHRLEVLQSDRDELTHQCQSLQDQIQKNKLNQSNESEEFLRAELKAINQRLEVTERDRRDIYEEKCELEEAENDARLMVQRLESQLDAAREMESLLSASLSQEQQLSREMQKKFREFQQLIEKDRRFREESIERQSSQKLAEVTEAKEALAAQLNFTACGLYLAQMWRQVAADDSPKALVPCTNVLNTPIESKENKDNLVNTKMEVCVQTNQNLLDQEIQTNDEDMEVTCQSTRALSDEDESSPVKKRMKSMNTRSVSTMTHLDELLSEREKYYLEQIETLQKQKMSLRKDQDLERSDSLQHYTDLEVELKELKEKLEESENNKCNLLFRLEEVEDSRDIVRREMQQRLTELKENMNRNNDIHLKEKAALERSYETRLQEMLEDRKKQEMKLQEVEQHLAGLRKELETVASDLVEFESGDESSRNASKSTGKTFKAESDGELLDKIKELVKSESSLRQKIGELEKKESAYRETIEEADKIMLSHASSYTHQIEELEATIERQQEKIKLLETSEERMRGALRTSSRSNDNERISELLDKVIHTENSELRLKEKVWSLERTEKELQIKMSEAEKTNQSLRSELHDQEELLHRLGSLQTENNLLSVELQQAHDAVRKFGDVQQSESYFRSRVEELEATENSLRDSLHQTEVLMVQKERKLKEQIRLIEEELQTTRSQSETSHNRALHSREIEQNLKRQIEELRSRLQESEKELKDSSSENINHETQHRSEVTKLRNQLKLVNSQLTDLDGLNCILRDKVTATESEKENLSSQLLERIRRHEQDIISLNFQISSKDQKTEELEGQLQQLRHTTAAGELDVLSSSPLSSIHSALTQLTSTVQNCSSCSGSERENLSNITQQLGTLTDLLDGRSVCNDDAFGPSDNEGASDIDGLPLYM